MSINNNLARIRAKFDTSPPYDWEDDVQELIDTINNLQIQLTETEARADANFRLYQRTEKYHNEDMVLMQAMERVIATVRRVVSGSDSENYAKLSQELDTYDQVKRERDRTF